MTDVTILDLPLATSIDGSEFVEIVQSGTSKKVQAGAIGAAGAGSVQSVGLAMPNIFSVSGSPVIVSGTLTAALETQSANQFFSGPLSGPAAQPSFRPFVINDLPSIAAGSVIANVTGGTAKPTEASPTSIFDLIGSTQGGVVYRGASAWAQLAPGTSGQLLATGGAAANPSWRNLLVTDFAAITAGTVIANVTGSPAVPTAATPSSVLDVIGSTRGQVLYRGTSGWSVLSPGTSGFVLTTNGAGADPAWAATGSGTVTSVASGTGLTGGPVTTSGTLSVAAHGITYALMERPTAASLLGNPTASLADVQEVALGATLAFSGTTLRTQASSGDVAWAANSFATAIAPNAVTHAKFQQIAARSIVGNATNATANTSALQGTTSQVLRVASDGLSLGFGQVDLTSASAVAGALSVANGGTGQSALNPYSVVLAGATSTGPLGGVGPDTLGHVLTAQGAGAYPIFASVSGAIDSIGSTQGDVLYRGASGWSVLGPGTDGRVLTTHGAGADPTWTAIAGSGTVTNIATGSGLTGGPVTTTGTISVATNGITYALFNQVGALSVVGNATNATANAADIVGTSNQVLRINSAGNALAFGQVNLASASAITGMLGVANGGTGLSSGTSGGLIYFSGASSIASSPALAQFGILYGGGAGSSPSATAAMTDGQLLVGQTGGAAVPKAISGDMTLSAAGAASVTQLNGVAAANYLRKDATATLTAGFISTSFNLGTITGANQTISPNAANGQHQYCTLAGSALTGTLTINPPAASTQVVLEVTNDGSGAVAATLSIVTTKVDGTWVSTNGAKFLFILTKTQTYSHCQILPLQ